MPVHYAIYQSQNTPKFKFNFYGSLTQTPPAQCTALPHTLKLVGRELAARLQERLPKLRSHTQHVTDAHLISRRHLHLQITSLISCNLTQVCYC